MDIVASLLVTSLAERACKPFQTLVETISRGGASGLNVLVLVRTYTAEILSSWRIYPGTLSQAVKAELVCNLGGVHGILNTN